MVISASSLLFEGTPMVVITVSTAIYNEGYGTEKHCWISTDKGLIWAFVGPVLFVILVSC